MSGVAPENLIPINYAGHKTGKAIRSMRINPPQEKPFGTLIESVSRNKGKYNKNS